MPMLEMLGYTHSAQNNYILYFPNIQSCVFKSYQEFWFSRSSKEATDLSTNIFNAFKTYFSIDGRIRCSFTAEPLTLSGQTRYKKGSAISSSKPETPYSAHSRFTL